MSDKQFNPLFPLQGESFRMNPLSGGHENHPLLRGVRIVSGAQACDLLTALSLLIVLCNINLLAMEVARFMGSVG